MKCESCGTEENIAGVACVPGVPYSACYCADCLRADSHPMWIVIANTAMCGGVDQCAEWWQEVVSHTLTHQNKTLEWFNAEVAKAIQEMGNPNL